MSLLTAAAAMGVKDDDGNPITDRVLLAQCGFCGQFQSLAQAHHVTAAFVGGYSAYECRECEADLLIVTKWDAVPLTPGKSTIRCGDYSLHFKAVRFQMRNGDGFVEIPTER